jgi:hypothetical protein
VVSADKVRVVAESIEVIVVPAGIPVPVTVYPGCSPVVFVVLEKVTKRFEEPVES